MGILMSLAWSLSGVLVGWGVTSLRASMAFARSREQMSHEIRLWQEEAQRYKAVADQVSQEKKAWAEGIKQGREEVISLVPLLLLAQRKDVTP
ncbi:MAG: hypothetical protein ACHP9Z_07815 [Streptosporangiales bacterium]